MAAVRVKLGDLIADRYRLDAIAGRGGVGVVHRATDTATGASVQVTVLYARIRAVLDPSRIEPVRAALAPLDAPALAVPIDMTSDAAAIVTAPVGGRSLAGLLADGPLAEPAVAALGADLADGLAALHDRGLTHRWIRPSAVAVDEGGRPVLLDVGVTELLRPQYYTAFERLVGTAAYVGPEQVRNELVGPATDVYALGLVLLEALTGVAPYPGTGADDAVARTLVAPVVPATADARLARLLTAATAFRPEDRPTAPELASGFRALMAPPEPAPAAVPVVPVAAPPVPGPVVRRRRRGVLVPAGLALLAAVVLAGGSTPAGRTPASVLAVHPASGVSAALGAEHAAWPVVSPSPPARPRLAAPSRPIHRPVSVRPSAPPVTPPHAAVAPAPPAPPSAAATPAPAPHRTSRPKPAPRPTSTPQPTSTPRPTSTPKPTITPTPTPAPSASATAAPAP